MKLKIEKLIKIGTIVVSIIFALTACQKRTSCEINGIVIDESIIGSTRSNILLKFGQPEFSDLGVKGFESFTFAGNNKKYAVILRYKIEDNTYYVSSQKCITVKPRFELFNYVIWH